MDLKQALFLKSVFQQAQLLYIEKKNPICGDTSSATKPPAWCFFDKTAPFDVLKSSGIVGFAAWS